MGIVNASDIIVSNMPMWWPDNIFVGVLFLILGICGAAIMVYIGEWDKLMGNSVRIIEIENEIEEKRKIASKITDLKDVDTRKKYEDMINEDEDRLDRERKDNRITGMVLYLFIGGAIAAILANSMVEAVGFGAGWTGFIGVFGIKKDNELKKESRNTETQSLDEKFEDLIKKIEDAYNRGFSDAHKQIAETENKNKEGLKGGYGIEDSVMVPMTTTMKIATGYGMENKELKEILKAKLPIPKDLEKEISESRELFRQQTKKIRKL